MEMKSYQCSICGYEWSPRSERPMRCPRCKSTRWDQKVIVDKCMRCGTTWTQRGPKEPKYCPACHSAVWKQPKAVFTCPRCGRSRPLRSNSRSDLCPYCDRYADRDRRIRTEYDAHVAGIGEVKRVWSDGKGRTMTSYDKDRDTVYLYEDGELVGSTSLARWCAGHGFQIGEVFRRDRDERVEATLVELAESIERDRGIHLERSSKIEEMTDATPEEAQVLALLDQGMDPLPIALKLKIPFTKVMDVVRTRPAEQ